MTKTKNLGLALLSSAEYDTTLRRDYIKALSGPEGTSNMQLIDKAVGDVAQKLEGMETALSKI